METTETYKGIEIEIKREEFFSENPFENWDGCVPLICDGGSMGLEKDYSNGEILDYLRNYLSYNQIKRHQKRIIEMMQGEKNNPYTYSYQDFIEEYPTNEFDRTEIIQNDLLYDFLDESIETMEIFCIEFNIKHYKSTSKGYCQSSWSDIFTCWTPEFEKITGRSYESMDEKDFIRGFNLWGYWAWGDIYSYTISTEKSYMFDSCGGFYGANHVQSGLMGAAENAIDCYLAEQKEKKQNHLKILIKNRVPLNKRTQLIA